MDEEKLERVLLKVKEAQRKGWLQSDRTSPSWKEFRRRQKGNKKRIEQATGQRAKGKAVPGGVDVLDV